MNRQPLMAVLPANSHRVTDAEFLDAFGTTGGRGRFDQASLVEHLRTRRTPRWFFDARETELPVRLELPWPHSPDLARERTLWLADELLRGHVILSGGIEIDLPTDFRWRNDETLNFGVPGNAFRCGGVFLTLALAYEYARDTRYLDGLKRLIAHWLTEWPFEIDEGFDASSLVFSKRSSYKSMPTGHRICNWISMIHTSGFYELPNELAFGLLRELICSAAGYLHYLDAAYHEGNHHIMRCGTIPAIVSIMFPEVGDLSPLEPLARRTIAAHLSDGVLDDRGYEERSFSYSCASLSMIGVPELLARRNGKTFLTEADARTLATTNRTYLHLNLGSAGAVPVGDGEQTSDRVDSFSRLGEALSAHDERTGVDEPRLLYLPRAGYLRMRTDQTAEVEAVAVVSIPDGSNPVIGHSHDDTLSVWYGVDGVRVIDDPAAELYLHVNRPTNRDTPRRGYFYSALAHNAPIPRGQPDESIESCIHCWGVPVVPVDSRIEADEDALRVTAERGTRTGCRIVRNVSLRFDGELEILDTIDDPVGGAEPHRLRWHFGYGVEVSLSSRTDGRVGFSVVGDRTMIRADYEMPMEAEIAWFRNVEWLADNPLRPDAQIPWIIEITTPGSRGTTTIKSGFRPVR